MLKFIGKYKVQLLGIGLGAIGGAAYYYFVGCNSGHCAIASNPFVAIPYGAIMGFLLVGIFDKKQKPEHRES